MTDQSRKVFKKNPEILNDILLYQKDTGTAQEGEQVGHEKYLLV